MKQILRLVVVALILACTTSTASLAESQSPSAHPATAINTRD